MSGRHRKVRDAEHVKLIASVVFVACLLFFWWLFIWAGVF